MLGAGSAYIYERIKIMAKQENGEFDPPDVLDHQGRIKGMDEFRQLINNGKVPSKPPIEKPTVEPYAFPEQEMKKLEALRRQIETGEVSDQTKESKQLRFGRWLNDHGKIGKGDKGTDIQVKPATVKELTRQHGEIKNNHQLDDNDEYGISTTE